MGVNKETHRDEDLARFTFPGGTAEFLDIRGAPTHDAVFGQITDESPNYRNVGWIGTIILMLKSQIGLGVLTIPLTFSTLGLVPGLICMYAIAIMTTWSDYIVGVFKLKHPDVDGISDVGRLIAGPTGEIFFFVAYCLYWVFVAGSGMLGISIGLNSLSTHATCTAVFVAVAFLVAFVLSSIQTLGRITWLAWIGLFGILASIFTLTISVGLEERPAAAPQEGPWVSDFKIFGNPTWPEAITAVSSLAFAYAGTPSFFAIVSEMRDPRKYARSWIICQIGVTFVYIAIGVVVYYYCGSYVASPALGSANAVVKKVCYGLALPGLIVTTTLVTHLPAKIIFIRILKGSQHLNTNTAIHWIVWLSCTFSCALVAYIIASAIPNFGGLVSLIGALLGTLMSLQPMGVMWLCDNWESGKTRPTLKWYLMVGWPGWIIIAGMFLMVTGTYGSVVDIIDTPTSSGPWSCADNSGSV